MLCEKCNGMLDFDNLMTEEGYTHHASYTNLVRSANSGCELCQCIKDQQAVRGGGELDDAYDQEMPADETGILCELTSIEEYLRRFRRILEIWQPGRLKKHDISNVKMPYLYVTLRFATSANDPIASLVRGRPVNTDTSSVGCFDLAAGWISTCLEKHDKCPPNSNNKLPTRVIKVGSSDGSQEPFLLITHGERGQWVTLSHCWGSKAPAMTTTQTLSDQCKQIRFRDLPPLYQDAVDITRRLGYRYLWVDSLCILQDSLADWRAESAQMGIVYRNAVLNISADSSPDPDGGIFDCANSTRPFEVPLLSLPCRSSTHQLDGSISIYQGDPKDEIYNPLQTRAWVLQEKMFSPRKLHYQSDEIYWSCETIRYCCESQPEMDQSLPPNKGLHSIFQMPYLIPQKDVILSEEERDRTISLILDLWYRTLNDYAERQITFSSDRLPAIAGFAKEVAAHTGYQYKAGIWLEDCHAGLLWNTQCVGVDTRHAPSWSWAVIDNRRTKRLRYGDGKVAACKYLMRDEFRAKIISVHVESVNNDPFGQVQSAYITLEARWRSVDWNDQPMPLCDVWPTPNYIFARRRKVDGTLEQDMTAPCQIVYSLDERVTSDDFMLDFIKRKVIYMQIGRFGDGGFTEDYYGRYALLLEPTGRAVNEFRRIGIAQIPEVEAMADGWETRTVTVV